MSSASLAVTPRLENCLMISSDGRDRWNRATTWARATSSPPESHSAATSSSKLAAPAWIRWAAYRPFTYRNRKSLIAP